jgi:hypothetical protein
MPRSTIIVNGIKIVSSEWRSLVPEYYPNGNIKHGLLDMPTEIQGFPMCCEVSFYPSGKLKSGRLDRHITINGIEYYEYLYLYENGNLHSSKLVDDTVFNKIKFKYGQYIDFDQHGNVRAGFITDEIETNGLKIPANSFIKFDSLRIPSPCFDKSEGEHLSWEPGQHGVSVNQYEVVAWTNDAHGGVGSSCSFRDFLQGTLNELVESNIGEEVYQEVCKIVYERHLKTSDIIVEIKLKL